MVFLFCLSSINLKRETFLYQHITASNVTTMSDFSVSWIAVDFWTQPARVYVDRKRNTFEEQCVILALLGSKGRTPSFLSSTIICSAASNATWRCSAVSTASGGIFCAKRELNIREVEHERVGGWEVVTDNNKCVPVL